MLKRQFKNPYYHFSEDLIEEAWYNNNRLKQTTVGALAGGALVAGGIAAYNQLSDGVAYTSPIDGTTPAVGGGILGAATGIISKDLLPVIGGFIGTHAATIGSSLATVGIIAEIIMHPYLSLGIVTSLGSFAYVLNKKENVDECKQLSTFIEKVYNRAILLRYNDLQTIKDSNQKAFQEASSKCELGGPAFSKSGLSVNYNCALEAYVGYCTAMFTGLLTVYLQSVNAKGINLKHVSKIEQVLAIQEDTGLNIMLNQVYRKLIKSIAFIFKPFPEVVTKYNIFIDNTILDLTQKLDTKVHARPIQQQYQHNNPRPAYKPNDHRQFKNKYNSKPV